MSTSISDLAWPSMSASSVLNARSAMMDGRSSLRQAKAKVRVNMRKCMRFAEKWGRKKGGNVGKKGESGEDAYFW